MARVHRGDGGLVVATGGDDIDDVLASVTVLHLWGFSSHWRGSRRAGGHIQLATEDLTVVRLGNL